MPKKSSKKVAPKKKPSRKKAAKKAPAKKAPAKKAPAKKAAKKAPAKKAPAKKAPAKKAPAKKVAVPLPVSMVELPHRVRAALAPLSMDKKRFVIFYCTRANGNAGLAAKLAGFAARVRGGPSKATYPGRGFYLKSDPKVRKAIDVWMDEFALSRARVTRMMADLAEANLGPFLSFEKDGSLSVKVLDGETWEAHKHWIKRIECDPITGKVTKVEVYDRKQALDSLAKIMGMMSSNEAHLHLHLYKNMSDEELLQELELHRDAIAEGPYPAALLGSVGSGGSEEDD
jgi:hypothetical protein